MQGKAVTRVPQFGQGRVIALTGATGFLGSNLLSSLGSDSRVERVVAIDVISPKRVSPKTRAYEVDFTWPNAEARLSEILSAERAHTLVHLAFLSSPTPASAWAHEFESVGTM